AKSSAGACACVKETSSLAKGTGNQANSGFNLLSFGGNGVRNFSVFPQHQRDHFLNRKLIKVESVRIAPFRSRKFIRNERDASVSLNFCNERFLVDAFDVTSVFTREFHRTPN